MLRRITWRKTGVVTSSWKLSVDQTFTTSEVKESVVQNAETNRTHSEPR